jgi:hypothetical protein
LLLLLRCGAAQDRPSRDAGDAAEPTAPLLATGALKEAGLYGTFLGDIFILSVVVCFFVRKIGPPCLLLFSEKRQFVHGAKIS